MSNIHFAAFDAAQHDVSLVADLIARSDEQINPLVYGNNTVEVIVKMVQAGGSYFDGKYLRVVIWDGEIVGVVVGYPVKEKATVDKLSGPAFAKAMGFIRLVPKIRFFQRLDGIMAGHMDPEGYYIHTLSIAPKHQGQGLGTKIMAALAAEHNIIYLHVNSNKTRSYSFYEKVGFREQSRGQMVYKGQELLQSLMVLQSDCREHASEGNAS